MKHYLEVRDCHKSYTGGISSFLLFYMCVAFYQNRDCKDEPDMFGFLKFYAEFDEQTLGLQIDLSEILPDEYSPEREFPRIIDLPAPKKSSFYVMRMFASRDSNDELVPYLYIRDPIGKFFYRADPTGTEMTAYRENIGIQAFRYATNVKNHFIESYQKLG